MLFIALRIFFSISIVLLLAYRFNANSFQQPQGDYIELARKRFGYRLDHHERLYLISIIISNARSKEISPIIFLTY